MQKDVVKALIDAGLEEKPDLFLIDFQINSANQIKVILDSDTSVSVSDCMAISRAVEHNLDREVEDFSIEVTSAGVSTPLQIPRQFKKNIGRKLKLKTAEEKYEATLTAADDEKITLEWKQREPKPIGKGKHTVEKKVELTYDKIEEAIVMIIFN